MYGFGKAKKGKESIKEGKFLKFFLNLEQRFKTCERCAVGSTLGRVEGQ